MTLTLFENTYVSLEDAETYFSGRLYANAWDNASDTSKEKALITASKKIDKIPNGFLGIKKVSTQRMEFPRSFVDNSCGALFYQLPPELPQDIIDAVCEEALALLEYGNSAHIKNKKLGISSVMGVSYDNKEIPQILSAEAYSLISNWIHKGFDIAPQRFIEVE